MLSLKLRCPVCFSQMLGCGCVCGFTLSQKKGIWDGISRERESYFQQFIKHYATVRTKEGRGSSSSQYYLALPFKDLTGRHAWEWRIRARTFHTMIERVLPEIEDGCPQKCDVLDIGAGNCWLSYRLALRGHRPVAVDILDDDTDGLGAARHYFPHLESPFLRFKAEMDRLPFASAQFDVSVFNASFHYSVDYHRTLAEVLRCLRRPGYIIIIDSPLYSRDESGQRMLQERRAVFERQYGVSSDSIASREYLTPKVLKELAERLGINWTAIKPWYGVNWAARPLKARLLRRREPSKFYLFWSRVEK
jgi:SAM-dependent methyltransferase